MPQAVIAAGIAGAATSGSTLMANRASANATRTQTEYANQAAALEAKTAEEQLAFLKEQEATRRAEWEATQQRNYEMWLERRRDLAPYRNLGAGSVAQMAMPIPKSPTDKPNAQTIGSILGR